MSYPYRIVVSRSVCETVTAEDEARNELTLTEYLPRERMKEIFESVLERRGWKKKEEGVFEKTGGRGELVEIDTGAMTVTTKVKRSATIEKERTLEGRGYVERGNVEDVKARRRERLEKELDKQLEITAEERTRRGESLKHEAAEILRDTAAARMDEFNDIVMEVYADSLREKARLLGEVVSVSENRSDDGSVFEMEIIIRE